MKIDSEKVFDGIFLSYEKILVRLNTKGATTKNGREITFTDLKQAVNVMIEKHPSCRWRSEKIRSRKYYVLIEGYYWLEQVYFQREKSLLDADVDFFERRIKEYENLLKIEHSENWWNDDMDIKELCNYFDREDITVRKAIRKMCDRGFSEYRFLQNGKIVVSCNGVKWLCKNCFKQKYLELLEKYKMNLTEMYIEKGYIYDEFFERN